MEVTPDDRIKTAIDMLIALIVNEIASEENRSPSTVISEFLASQTAQMLYDESTKLWWDGPADIIERYREEKLTIAHETNHP